MSELPRGLRNRNPGNIRRSAVRYKGETESDDAAFKTFASTAWGYRAMFVLLHTYRVRHRIATLRGMIARWAPPSENDTDAYLTFHAIFAVWETRRCIRRTAKAVRSGRPRGRTRWRGYCSSRRREWPSPATQPCRPVFWPQPSPQRHSWPS